MYDILYWLQCLWSVLQQRVTDRKSSNINIPFLPQENVSLLNSRGHAQSFLTANQNLRSNAPWIKLFISHILGFQKFLKNMSRGRRDLADWGLAPVNLSFYWPLNTTSTDVKRYHVMRSSGPAKQTSVTPSVRPKRPMLLAVLWKQGCWRMRGPCVISFRMPMGRVRGPVAAECRPHIIFYFACHALNQNIYCHRI